MFSYTRLMGIKRATQRLTRFKHTGVAATSTEPTAGESTTASSSASTTHVRYETDGSLAIITLCHPAVRNALDVHMMRHLDQVFAHFEADPTVNVGVLVGTGGSFSVGADLNASTADYDEVSATQKSTSDWSTGRRTHFRKPMVCGIDGYCVGSGLELALMCDLRVVEDDACLGFFNRRYGVPLRGGACQRLPALVGLSRALDLVLTGRTIGGKEAVELGLANRLVANGTALGQTVTLAKSIAKYPQASLLYDREALFRATYGHVDWQNAETSEEIASEIRNGRELLKSARSPTEKSQNKTSKMADWEISEYKIELENQEKSKS